MNIKGIIKEEIMNEMGTEEEKVEEGLETMMDPASIKAAIEVLSVLAPGAAAMGVGSVSVVKIMDYLKDKMEKHKMGDK